MALCSGFTPCQCASPFQYAQSTRRYSDRHVARASAGTSYQDASTAVDYGRILGVSPDAPKCEVKAAYRKLALRFHPDVCKGDRPDVNFTEVNRAYEALMAMAIPCSGNQSQQGYGYSSYDRDSSAFNGYQGADPVSGSQEEDPWADFLQSLVNGTHEALPEDYSSYYSNLKQYSKAGRNKGYQYYQGNW